MQAAHFTDEANLAADAMETKPARRVAIACVDLGARRSDFDVFAPSPRHELEDAIARIHRRARSLTPVLEGILRHPLPAPRLTFGT